MEAATDGPMFMRGREWPRWLLWAAAFVVPLAFDVALATRDFAYEGNGSCRYLTGAGKAEFADAVLGLQITLVAWVVAGAALATLHLVRGMERSGGAWLTIAGWLAGSVGAIVLAWYGPTIGGLGKVIVIFVYVPLVLAACALVMILGLVWRRVRGHAFPVGLLMRSQAVLAALLIAGSFLGGTGEIDSC